MIVAAGHPDLRDHRRAQAGLGLGPDGRRCSRVALAALATLVPYELRRRDPLIEPRFFRSPPFTGATLIAISAFAGFAGFLLLNTLYLQEVRGYSALQAGLSTLPMAVLAGLFAPLSGRVVGRHGARPALIFGGVCMLVAPLLLTEPLAHHPARPAARRLRDLRHGLRRDQPADHLHGRLRACPTARRAWPPRSPRPAARSGRPSASP